jgi:hypothetical protein
MSVRRRRGGPTEAGHEWDAARDQLIGNWLPNVRPGSAEIAS